MITRRAGLDWNLEGNCCDRYLDPKSRQNNDPKHIKGHDPTYFGGCRFIVNDQTPCYGDFLTATQVPAADPNSLRPVFPDNSRISYKKDS